MIKKTYTMDFSGLLDLTLIIEYANELIPKTIQDLDIVDRTEMFTSWAAEYGKAHENFDYEKYPYLEELEKFIEKKGNGNG